VKFSVLMSIYNKENPEYFNRCMKSIWDEQTIKPDEIVLVEDGLLNEQLYNIIEKWQNKLGKIFKRVFLKQNVGTGKAKNEGLKYCSYELIAIMDTDDISLPKRFEKQLEIFKTNNIDVCGSWVSEFEDYETNIISFRKVPKSHEKIVEFAKKRMPVNHPSIMYKKNIALNAGGYKHMLWFEDYYLMVRMILNGAKFYNIQEPLVKMRIGYEQLKRRSGFRYIQAEIKFLITIKQEGFLNNYEFIRNLFFRLIARLMPKFFLKQIYKILRQ